jgi:hypothetical protein
MKHMPGHWSFTPNHVAPIMMESFSVDFRELDLSSDSLSSFFDSDEEESLSESTPRKRKGSDSFVNSPHKSPTLQESRPTALAPESLAAAHVPVSSESSASAHVPGSPQSSASASAPGSPQSSASASAPGSPQSSPSSRTPSAMDVARIAKNVEMLGNLQAVLAITEICAVRCKKVSELAKQKMVDMGEGILSEAPLNELKHEIEDAEAVLAITRKYIN